MDGVVVVEKRTGALHFTRAFSRAFDLRHAKADRMNLGALLFALQNFAGNSFHSDSLRGDTGGTVDPYVPEIALFETPQERIALSQSTSHKLLIALFVRPSVATDVAKSLVRRIAYHYDHDESIESRLATMLNQSARLFREACERAIEDEVDQRLRAFAPHAVFLAIHYSPSVNFRRRSIGGQSMSPDREAGLGLDDSDDDGFGFDDDAAYVSGGSGRQDALDQEADVQSLSSSPLRSPATNNSPTPSRPERLQRLFASTRSILSTSPVKQHSRNKKKKKKHKNAVMDLAEPKAFVRHVSSPPSAGFPTSTDPTAVQAAARLATLIQHPQFSQAIMDTLQPVLKTMAPLMFPRDQRSGRRQLIKTLKEITWRNFPLPQFSMPTSVPSVDSQSSGILRDGVAANMRIWKRDGYLLLYLDAPSFACECVDVSVSRSRVNELLDATEPLARCFLKLAS